MTSILAKFLVQEISSGRIVDEFIYCKYKNVIEVKNP
jgi:hypothetical protein